MSYTSCLVTTNASSCNCFSFGSTVTVYTSASVIPSISNSIGSDTDIALGVLVGVLIILLTASILVNIILLRKVDLNEAFYNKRIGKLTTNINRHNSPKGNILMQVCESYDPYKTKPRNEREEGTHVQISPEKDIQMQVCKPYALHKSKLSKEREEETRVQISPEEDIPMQVCEPYDLHKSKPSNEREEGTHVQISPEEDIQMQVCEPYELLKSKKSNEREEGTHIQISPEEDIPMQVCEPPRNEREEECQAPVYETMPQ